MGRAMARVYEFVLQQHLGPGVTALFPEFSARHDRDGTTALTGTLPDQAALHGALARVRDLGLVLDSVRYLDAENASGSKPAASATDGDLR